MKSDNEGPSLQNAMRSARYRSRMWELIKPYWFSDDRWPGIGLLLLVIALTLASVYILVQLADWNRLFFNSLQDKNFADFLQLLIRFCVLTVFYMFFAAYGSYFNQMLQIRWRRWLTEQYCQDWLTDRSYYLLQLEKSDMENPEQRIQEDIGIVTSLTLDLGMGLLNSVVTLAAFLVMLWNLSGALTFHVGGLKFTIPGYLVWIAIIYSAFGSIATHYVGRSLIGIKFNLQRFGADFRFRMMRIRENAESVALYGGESEENEKLKTSFASIWRTWWQLMKARKRLTFFTAGYQRIAVVFPILVASPRYFSGAMQLGGLTQTALAFAQVMSSLSWFVGVYPNIAQWLASMNRLMGFSDALIVAKQLPASSLAIRSNGAQSPELKVEDMTIRLPDQRVILDAVSLHVNTGDRVLVSGPSGSGKSTLFRAIAGIWPYGSGVVSMPDGRVLFLPQKPYLPIATLREVLSYPGQSDGRDEEEYRQALADAYLPQLVDRLDEENNWSLGLSGGEQQRIGFARVFLCRPDWLFMDEATSAVDEPTEKALFDRLQEKLPGITIISVAYRAGVARFHKRNLIIQPETKSLEEVPLPDPIPPG